MNRGGTFQATLIAMAMVVFGAGSAAQEAEQSPNPPQPRIAVFSGPTATIQNAPPLITSNQARLRAGLPGLRNRQGAPVRYDHLVPQRLAAPAEVYVEQFSAHPLEQDAAHLYGPPDGYIDADGRFHEKRQSPEDRPVYRITLRPEDGLFLLPYMAMQADGRPWDDTCSAPFAQQKNCRQTFYPDASRIFEEIDRSLAGRDQSGRGDLLRSKADFDFYRAAPSGGYTRGLPAGQRTDVGQGDIPSETPGRDFFAYRMGIAEPPQKELARVTNIVQRAMGSGGYAGGVWLEGSPTVADTLYWLNLLVDTRVPITGNAAQRVHGSIGQDGARNIIDSVDYILSRSWADADGSDTVGAVLLQEEQIFTARQAEKQDARPGGYVAAGAHGGIIGTIGDPGPVTLWFKPTTRHTWRSEVNLTRLPATVQGVTRRDGRGQAVTVAVKDEQGGLRGEAIPKVTIVRHNRWLVDDAAGNLEEEVEVLARLEKNLAEQPLAGFVAEGLTPYGALQPSLAAALEVAAMSGMPVVRVSRGDQAGMVPAFPGSLTIAGNNLTPTKARLLLMAALMKFGSLPLAADPRNPTAAERKAVTEKIRLYQEIFNTH